MNYGKNMKRMWKQNKEKTHETFCKKREEEYICSGLRQQQLLCWIRTFVDRLNICRLMRHMKYKNLLATSFFNITISF